MAEVRLPPRYLLSCVRLFVPSARGWSLSLSPWVDPQGWIRWENEVVNLPMVGHAQGSGYCRMVFAREYGSIFDI